MSVLISKDEYTKKKKDDLKARHDPIFARLAENINKDTLQVTIADSEKVSIMYVELILQELGWKCKWVVDPKENTTILSIY